MYHSNFAAVAGAGGGGWYGGGSGAAYSWGSQGGGGGSGWTYTAKSYNDWLNGAAVADTAGWLLNPDYHLKNSQTVAGNLSVPNHSVAGSYVTGNSGHGFARITRYVPNSAAISTRKVVMDIGGTAAPCVITSWSDTEIRCVTSAHAAGYVSVTIGNDVSSGVLLGAFEYYEPLSSNIEINPTQGPAAGGTDITIRGSGFGSASVLNAITFKKDGSSVDCTITSWTATEVHCTTVAYVPAVVDVLIMTQYGQKTITHGYKYIDESAPPPNSGGGSHDSGKLPKAPNTGKKH
jgi:hypothetical protein